MDGDLHHLRPARPQHPKECLEHRGLEPVADPGAGRREQSGAYLRPESGRDPGEDLGTCLSLTIFDQSQVGRVDAGGSRHSRLRESRVLSKAPDF